MYDSTYIWEEHDVLFLDNDSRVVEESRSPTVFLCEAIVAAFENFWMDYMVARTVRSAAQWDALVRTLATCHKT